jgi:predicted amidohydrolase
MADTTRIGVLVAQFPVSLDIDKNLDAIVHVLDCAREEVLVILPEGALSGYAEDAAFLQAIDIARLTASWHFLAEEATRRNVHLIFGSCLQEAGQWYNTGIYHGPRGEQFVYRKINLATGEQNSNRRAHRRVRNSTLSRDTVSRAVAISCPSRRRGVCVFDQHGRRR